jgi:hypothetical protein
LTQLETEHRIDDSWLLCSKEEPDANVADAVTALIYSAPHTELKGELHDTTVKTTVTYREPTIRTARHAGNAYAKGTAEERGVQKFHRS